MSANSTPAVDSRPRKALFGALLATIPVVLTVAGAEVFLRLRAAGRERQAALAAEQARDPTREISRAERLRPSAFADIIYEMKPGIDGLFQGRRLRTNAFGLRGAETRIAKPPGVTRIVGLGDSHMFGWGVDQEDVYLERLARELADRRAACPQAPAHRVETLNFAVPGYNTVMEAATLEHRALAFSPDVVVLHFVGNDEQIPHFLDPSAAETAPASYLWDLLRRRFSAARPSDAPPDGEDGENTAAMDEGDGNDDTEAATESAGPRDRRRRGRRLAQGLYAHMAGTAAFSAAMDRIGNLARARDLPVIVVALGHSERPALQDAVRRNGMRYLNFAPTLHRHLMAIGGPDDKTTWVKTFEIPGDGHPNALAHRLFAQALAEELLRTGLVPDC